MQEAPALDDGAVVHCDEGGGGEVGDVCVGGEGDGRPDREGEKQEGKEVHGAWVLGIQESVSEGNVLICLHCLSV